MRRLGDNRGKNGTGEWGQSKSISLTVTTATVSYESWTWYTLCIETLVWVIALKHGNVLVIDLCWIYETAFTLWTIPFPLTWQGSDTDSFLNIFLSLSVSLIQINRKCQEESRCTDKRFAATVSVWWFFGFCVYIHINQHPCSFLGWA